MLVVYARRSSSVSVALSGGWRSVSLRPSELGPRLAARCNDGSGGLAVVSYTSVPYPGSAVFGVGNSPLLLNPLVCCQRHSLKCTVCN